MAYKINKATPMLALLLAINVVVYIILVMLNVDTQQRGIELLEAMSLHSDIDTVAARPWTMVTYSFVNASFGQLFFNMLFLVVFGSIFAHKPGALIMAYIVGALSGALFYLLLYPQFSDGSDMQLVGSSSSVLAVVAIVAGMAPSARFPLPLFGRVKLKTIVLIVAVLFLVGLSADNAGGNLAHIGGLLGGLGCAFILKLRIHKADDSMAYRRLLDKVRDNGYESLSDDEKEQLIKYSSRCR